MTRLFLILLSLLGVVGTHAGYEVKLSTTDLLAQTDVVVVGSLTNVKEWSADKVDYGEGTIEVTESLLGAVTDTPWSGHLIRHCRNPARTDCHFSSCTDGKSAGIASL